MVTDQNGDNNLDKFIETDAVTSNINQKCIVNLAVPFREDRLAKIALNSIDSDEVPNPDLISRNIQVDGNKLKCTIECEDLFKLRTSLNNYVEAILQVQKTIDRFET